MQFRYGHSGKGIIKKVEIKNYFFLVAWPGLLSIALNKNNTIMTLENSPILEKRLMKLDVPKALKNQISLYIKNNTGVKRISNLCYRSNLHYIKDNIEKEGLLSELKKINMSCEVKKI